MLSVSNRNLKALVFEEGGKWSTGKKPPRSKGENQQQTQQTHMVLPPRLEPGPHWWEERALTSAPTLLFVKQKALGKILTKKAPKMPVF